VHDLTSQVRDKCVHPGEELEKTGSADNVGSSRLHAPVVGMGELSKAGDCGVVATAQGLSEKFDPMLGTVDRSHGRTPVRRR
jgi:hypothetical protein